MRPDLRVKISLHGNPRAFSEILVGAITVQGSARVTYASREPYVRFNNMPTVSVSSSYSVEASRGHELDMTSK